MKRVTLESRRERHEKRKTAQRKWRQNVNEHPIPDIQVELLAIYQRLTGDTSVTRAEYGQSRDILHTDDLALIWSSPTTDTIRYGPLEKPWPVSNKSLWPLNEQRTYQVPVLPKDVWECICRLLKPKYLLRLSLVSRKLREIVCNPLAVWWTSRRLALLERHPSLTLPDEMWKWYGRWKALACGSVRASPADYEAFLIMCLPPGIAIDRTAPPPDVASVQNTAKTRTGKFRVFTKCIAYVYARGSWLSIFRTKAPVKYMFFWGAWWGKKIHSSINWKWYAKRLLGDEELESYLKNWVMYNETSE